MAANTSEIVTATANFSIKYLQSRLDDRRLEIKERERGRENFFLSLERKHACFVGSAVTSMKEGGEKPFLSNLRNGHSLTHSLGPHLKPKSFNFDKKIRLESESK